HVDRIALPARAQAGIDVVAEVERIALAIPGKDPGDLLAECVDAGLARECDRQQGEAQAVGLAGLPRLADRMVGIVLVGHAQAGRVEQETHQSSEALLVGVSARHDDLRVQRFAQRWRDAEDFPCRWRGSRGDQLYRRWRRGRRARWRWGCDTWRNGQGDPEQ